MKYSVFINVLTASVQELLPECEVSLREIVKNNNVILYAISIKTENINAAPTIYLEQFYEAYKDGEDIRTIACRIIKIYEESRLIQSYDFSNIQDYEKAIKNIYFKAINYRRNNDFLKDVPYYMFEDLALVPYYLINDEIFGQASVVIHNNLFEIWQVDTKKFYEDVMDNLENHFKYSFMPINDVLSTISDDNATEDFPSIGMYVLYPVNKLYGAALIAVESVLNEIAQTIKGDYYILPSSVHELIIVRSDSIEDVNILNNIIMEVNNTAVTKEDFLSDHAYYYRCGQGITV